MCLTISAGKTKLAMRCIKLQHKLSGSSCSQSPLLGMFKLGGMGYKYLSSIMIRAGPLQVRKGASRFSSLLA